MFSIGIALVSLDLFSIDSSRDGLSHPVKPTKSKSEGLYDNSAYVTEVSSEAEYNELMKERKDPKIVVYYSPWCPHCRHFVPKYDKVAQEIYSKTSRASVSFFAVSCTAFRDICQKAKIKQYPMILAYRYDLTEPKDLDGDKGIMKYVRNDLQLMGASPDTLPSDSVKNSNSISTSTSTNTNINTATKAIAVEFHRAAREASTSQRFKDAVSSFFYLLLTQVSDSFNPDQTSALRATLKLLTAITPENDQSLRALWSTLLTLVPSPAAPITASSPNLRADFNKAPPADPYNPPTEPVRSALRQYAAAHFEHGLTWEVCGLEAAGGAEEGESEEGAGARGFTCGMWYLMHFFTVSGEAHKDRDGFGAVAVMDTIYHLVEQFFTCDECRGHFIKEYKSGAFGRSDIKSDDYAALSLWLFHFHNSVSLRVNREMVSILGATEVWEGDKEPEASTKPIRRAELPVLWPEGDQCPRCISPLMLQAKSQTAPKDSVEDIEDIYSAADIVKFLKKYYSL